MKYAAYGTLRGGLHSVKYLTDKYGQDAVKVLGDYDLPGFQLFTRWYYLTGRAAPANAYGAIQCPFAYPGKGKIRVTILDIEEPHASSDIDSGERWAYDKVEVDVPGFGKAFLYQSHYKYNHESRVKNGDYLTVGKKATS